MITIKGQTESTKLKKSTLLKSLETIESLVDMTFKMSLRQSVNGLSLAIVSECSLAYRLTMNLVHRHLTFIYIDEDNDVDCDIWGPKLQRAARRFDVFDDVNCYNKTTLTPRNIVSVLSEIPPLHILWKSRYYERTVPLEVSVNSFGESLIKKWQEEEKCSTNILEYVSRVHDIVEDETYNLLRSDIYDSSLSEDDNKKHLHSQMELWKGTTNSAFRAIIKVCFALNQLSQARDIRRIPDHMFEDFCQIQINDYANILKTTSKTLDEQFYYCSYEIMGNAIKEEIQKRYNLLLERYKPELIQSFIDSEYLDSESIEYRGALLYGFNSVKFPVNMMNLGRYVYSLYLEHKDEEAKALLFDVCLLSQCMKKLKDYNTPLEELGDWSEAAHIVFLDKVKHGDKEYKTNLTTIKALCENYLANDPEGKSTDCRWLALLLFAKHWGFIKYKQQKNGKEVFEISKFVVLLEEWGIIVNAENITSYSFLLKSDTTDYQTTKLETIPLPTNCNSNKCNKTGVDNIQRFLNILFLNCNKEDIFE